MSSKQIQDQVDRLIQAYYDSGLRLLELIRSLDQGMNKRRKEQILVQVDSIINQLTQSAANSTATLLAMSYKQGVLEAVESMSTQGLKQINASLQPLIHQQAVQAIMDETFYNILEASNNMSNDTKKRFEEVVLNANQKSLVEGVSRRQATKNAIAELTQQQITGIVTANGSRVPVDKYMKGVIQYNQRKAHVTGSENTIVQNGLDLVYVNYVGITCEYCAQYQGRVYSISGKDPRFPKLEKRPPYHAHCVHSVSAFIEEYQPENEVERMLEVSNRPFEDNRTEANIKRYNELQKDKVRLNEDRKQWMRYTATVPENTPKSLAAFRRMKYNEGEGWKNLQGDYRKSNAYNKIIANEPKITADLQAVSKSTGVKMVGLEYRIKSKDSYLRKVSSDVKGTDLQAITDAISGTNDVIRYTYQSGPSKLVDEYVSVNKALSEIGYERIKVKNTWLVKSNPYKGINTNFRSADGQKFEIQFHTPESFALKNGELHSLYEKLRTLPNKASPEAIQLSKKMSEMSSGLQVPDRIDEVK